jgi:FkbM family methyltransferase
MHNEIIKDEFFFFVAMGECGDLLIDEIFDRDLYRLNDSKMDLVIDIGANCGIFSSRASRYANRIIAYEPLAENFKFLKKNLKHNKITNVEVHKLGLGKKGNARMIPMLSGSYVGVLGKEPVKLIGLDDIEFDRCDLLKVDCEGSEYDLFKYASAETLKKIKRFSMEVHKDLVDKKTHKEMIDKLEQFYELEYMGQMLYGHLRK